MLQAELDNFTGPETIYRVFLGCYMTEGVKYFTDKTDTKWLLTNIIFNCKLQPKLMNEGFITICCQNTSDIDANEGIKVVYEDGDGHNLEENFYPHVQLADAGKEEYKLWFTDDTLLLPSEY